jgi:hypothetical protein
LNPYEPKDNFDANIPLPNFTEICSSVLLKNYVEGLMDRQDLPIMHFIYALIKKNPCSFRVGTSCGSVSC